MTTANIKGHTAAEEEEDNTIEKWFNQLMNRNVYCVAYVFVCICTSEHGFN